MSTSLGDNNYLIKLFTFIRKLTNYEVKLMLLKSCNANIKEDIFLKIKMLGVSFTNFKYARAFVISHCLEGVYLARK